MFNFKLAIVGTIIDEDQETALIEININNTVTKAINYNTLTGKVNEGDLVLVNTTAVELCLGTGGYHFVIHNYRYSEKSIDSSGHIMKLRYTPYQIKVQASEEQDSPYHNSIKSFESLDGALVLVGSLHSMIAPVACMIKWLKPDAKINYIMTDAGALPMSFSNNVKQLKSKQIINNTITIGHSFGGDFECVNVYTGLITAKEILHSDVTIVCMGPGIVGTATKYGYSGIEQGYILDAVNTLQGFSCAVPRISFSDTRKRHNGISHHTLTVLGEIALSKCNLILPALSEEQDFIIRKQLIDCNIIEKHNIIYEDGTDIKKALDYFNLKTTTMGRGYNEDREFFISLGAVGKAAVAYLDNEK